MIQEKKILTEYVEKTAHKIENFKYGFKLCKKYRTQLQLGISVAHKKIKQIDVKLLLLGYKDQ